jgi:hypothetical protein
MWNFELYFKSTSTSPLKIQAKTQHRHHVSEKYVILSNIIPILLNFGHS